MGPGRAGKTALLVSMDQACSVPNVSIDGHRLEYVGGEGTRDLASWAIRVIEERDARIEPTNRPGLYDASITVTHPKSFVRPARQDVAHLVIRDGPGGVLFPATALEREQRERQEWERELIQDGREADTLVLCLDSTDPRIGIVSQHLRFLLAEMTRELPVTVDEPWLYRIRKKLRLARPLLPPRQRRLKARRFLVLFTKVDQLSSRPLHGASREPRPTPFDLATRLGPVQIACELIGEANLGRIRNALTPDAKLAVALTSAWGFDPITGMAFMAQDEPIRLSAQPRSRRIVDWRPFGVRDALLFMTTGVVGGAVEEVDPLSLAARLNGRRFDVPGTFHGSRSEGPFAA